jgi:hypothetical protein
MPERVSLSSLPDSVSLAFYTQTLSEDSRDKVWVQVKTIARASWNCDLYTSLHATSKSFLRFLLVSL